MRRYAEAFGRQFSRGLDVLTGVVTHQEPHEWCMAACLFIGFTFLLPVWLGVMLISWPVGAVSEHNENKRDGIKTVRE